MVTLKQTYVLLILFFCSASLSAQKQLRTEINFNKKAVYVGEPLEVSVAVYTTTWFTKGVDPGNVKIDGAYTVYFRSLSSSKTIDGKRYSGVTLFFNVFPYSDEDVVFPSLKFTIETPDEGDYVGVKHTIKTRTRKISVKPIPPGVDKQNWLVSSSVRVYDSWKGDVTKVKVGDVLERNITLKVGGTISEFIPAIRWDTIQNISLYPKRSNLKNNKTKTEISAVRTDGTRYLFEKEGTYEIPEITIQWWNPLYNKMYKRVLKSKTIHVAHNPDLGMLETVKNTLQESLGEQSIQESNFDFFGLSLKKFLALLLASIISIYFLIKIGIRMYSILKKRRKLYRCSEAYYFNLFLKTTKINDSVKSQEQLYHWLDRIYITTPTIKFFITKYGTKKLRTEFMAKNNLEILFFSTKEWKKSRKTYLKSKKNKPNTITNWVNP